MCGLWCFDELDLINVFSPPTPSLVSDVMHWRDPVRSGLLFGISNLSLYLLVFCDFAVIPLICEAVKLLLLVSLCWSGALALQSKVKGTPAAPNPFK